MCIKNTMYEFKKIKCMSIKTKCTNNHYHNYFAASLLIKNEKFSNIIEYWKDWEKRYSLLVTMTKNVLTMWCFDVKIKRLFNLARNVIIYKKKRLNSHIIESMMMIKYNLNYNEMNNSSSFNKYFANEFSFDESQTLLFILIENDF